MKTMNRVAFTFDECMKIWMDDGAKYQVFDDTATMFSAIEEQFETLSIFNGLFPSLLQEEGHEYTGFLFADILQAIYNRYKNQYFAYVETPYCPWSPHPSPSEAEIKKAIEDQMFLVFNYMEDTWKKYRKLLDLYDANKNKLMDKLSSHVVAGANTKGKSRFNDTPQTHPSSFDEFADADYTSNITISDSENTSEQTTDYDDANIMKRIDEISRLYESVLAKWAGEFDKFFWEE